MTFEPFENLRIFQLAEQLADTVWNIVNNWPPFARDTVGKQWVKSSDSVGANIAEGAGRGSKRDNQRFIKISRGSLNESKYWLRRADRRKLVTKDQVLEIKNIIDNLAPGMNAYLNSLKRE